MYCFFATLGKNELHAHTYLLFSWLAQSLVGIHEAFQEPEIDLTRKDQAYTMLGRTPLLKLDHASSAEVYC